MGVCNATSKPNKKYYIIKSQIQNYQLNYLQQLRQNQSQTYTQDQNKQFFKENDLWYHEDERQDSVLLFNTDLFIDHYINYIENQFHYAKIWEFIQIKPPHSLEDEMEIQVRSKSQVLDHSGTQAILNNWKYQIRSGLPLCLIRNIILNMFYLTPDKDLEYKNILDYVFKDKSSEQILVFPSFSAEDSDLSNLKLHILNEKGIQALKRILWCLKDTLPNLKFNPMIINTIQILFFFLNEWETFTTLKLMIENSIFQINKKTQKEMKNLRWHYTLNEEDFHKNSLLFIELAQKRNAMFKQIMNHFHSINFRGFTQICEELTGSLFQEVLKLPTVIRIFTVYINEGIRTFYKIIFGMCILLKDKFLNETNPDKIRAIFLNSNLDSTIEETELLFEKSYELKIGSQKQDFHRIKQDGNFIKKAPVILYRPRVPKDQSEILKYLQFEQIWQWIPKIYKLTNPVKFYTTSEDGYSLINVYQKCQNFLNKQLLIVIKSEHAIFGAFLDQMLDIGQQKEFYGGQDCFVFQLYPNTIVYNTTKKETKNQSENFHILTKEDYIQIGANNSAITLQKDLKGSTFKCETYESDKLNNSKSSEFTCLTLEMFSLTM